MPPNLLRRVPSSLMLLLKKTAPTTSLSALPDDLLLEIAEHLLRVDLLRLALTNTRFYRLFLPTLYASVDLRCNTHCQTTLTFLANHPHVALCVKSLIVRPNNEEWAQHQSAPTHEIETWVIMVISQTTWSNLREFVWDGTEFPKYDGVWGSLRNGCPMLRHVGVTVGLGDFTFRSRTVVPSKSTLFQFNDLTGFTLRVKQLVGSCLHPPFDELPQTFWDMLINRCPNLEHLAIDTVNERYIDVRPLFQGRWPKLRRLTLGDFVLLDAFATVDTSNRMANFLQQHQSLEHLTLHQLEGWYFPLSLALPPTALPNLKHFSARFLMIRSLPNVLSLESLELTNHPHGKYRMSGALWAISQLPALASLRIWIDCHDSGDADVQSEHLNYFTDILANAPRLRHLDVSCSSDPTFPVAEVTTALNRPQSLKSLFITQVKRATRDGGQMLKDAVMLFHENPQLELLKLQDAIARWRQPQDLRLQKVATFERIGGVVSVQETGLKRGLRHSKVYRHVIKR
ncbi:hypothetical protein FB45DRAFT_10706 [Roridomyces roridus]|uniref:F-box domain-containing protein n=1 Tax=Roridomyces roridus TaxID=1738132 RepID=A0AAD7FYA9_9AGAR|nr:hypothetical protein FB45DRAFT_10706 [Roridomyces roridus]